MAGYPATRYPDEKIGKYIISAGKNPEVNCEILKNIPWKFENCLWDSENRLRDSKNRLRDSKNRLRDSEYCLRDSKNHLRDSDNRLRNPKNRMRLKAPRIFNIAVYNSVFIKVDLHFSPNSNHHFLHRGKVTALMYYSSLFCQLLTS